MVSETPSKPAVKIVLIFIVTCLSDHASDMGLFARLTPQCVRNEIFATFKQLDRVLYVDKSQQWGKACGWRFLKTPDEVQP
ncbi:MAG: hypothetical protein WBO29_10525 [Albidovulum sp.]